MAITLTFEALSVGVGVGYALGWALTFEISYRNGTVRVGFELGLSRVSYSALALII